MILYEEDQRQLQDLCERLWRETASLAVFLIDSTGQLVAGAGETQHVDTTSLASLLAGAASTTGGLAQVLGEADFPTFYYEGSARHLYSAKLHEAMILTTLFDHRTSLGLVRMRVKRAWPSLEAAHDQLQSRQAQPPVSQASEAFELSDEDIDSFFGDAF